MTQYTLVDGGSLSTSLLLLDTRFAADYWAGHLPGARHLDPALLVLQRTDRPSIERFHGQLAWILSTLGIGTESRVVVHGAANEVGVSRVAWALGYAGIAEVALLDGGLQALHAPGLTTEAPAIHPRAFHLQPAAGWLATADDVLALQRDGGVVLDAREREEYVGLRSNARRHGRIPGAQHWDTARELDHRGRFRSAFEVAADAARLARPEQPVIAYCGGGGRAARTFVALRLAGHRHAAVYPASWNEWGNQDHLPVASGEPQALPA